MGFNSRFTTKPAVAKSTVTKPLKAKSFVNGVDEYEEEEQTPPGSTDRSRQSEASYTDDSGVSSPKTPGLGKEEISVVAAGGILLLLFSAFPQGIAFGCYRSIDDPARYCALA